MQSERLAWVLSLAACVSLAPAAAAQSSDTVKRLSEHLELSTLQSELGRKPDRSEAGGACGGIVIHDWVKEKVRVITLGESVQNVSEIKEGGTR